MSYLPNKVFMATLRMGREYLASNASFIPSKRIAHAREESLVEPTIAITDHQVCTVPRSTGHLLRIMPLLWRSLICGDGEPDLIWANPGASIPLRVHSFATILHLVGATSLYMSKNGVTQVDGTSKWNVVVLLALGVMGFGGVATSLLATGGVVAIVLGFAFREIGENFLAGFFLTFSRPFELDDLIKTGDLTGVVRSIELRSVHIRTFDACDVFVPNAQIFREPLYNYSRDGLRRPSFTVGVAYHDEPQQVIALLEKASTKTEGVLSEPRAFVTVEDFAAQFVLYQVFFWLDETNNERGYVATCNDVKINCWRALSKAGMTFSTDVSSGIDIQSLPAVKVDIANKQPAANGASS